MSSVICPTITAYNLHDYDKQMKRIVSLGAKRLHIDLMDGVFAPTKSPGLEQIWWPESVIADIHLMYQNPMVAIDQLIELKPKLVIIHEEAAVNHYEFVQRIHYYNIDAGLALLADTSVSEAESLLCFDHVLIFSGTLGRHGGQADLSLLEKVAAIRHHQPNVEIGWDGGVNDENAEAIIRGGVNVLNVGGFIHTARDPQSAYATLEAMC
jgi:ribulose-phosphate 3-epimerase